MHLLAATPVVTDVVSRAATATDYVLLGVYLLLAIGVSFLCSLLEAGLLSLPASHVEVMVQRKQRGGETLKVMKAQIDRPLAAILTLNTIAHTIGAAGVGAQILVIYGNSAVAIGSVIVTLLILVFSEIIPKSIGAAHAKRLAPFTALAIRLMIWTTWLLLVPLQWISGKLGGGHVSATTREEVAMTAELGHHAGVLEPRETRIIRNLFRLGQIVINDIMTPRPVMFTLPHDTTPDQVIDDYGRLRFTRIPVTHNSVDDVSLHVTRHAIHHARNEGRGHEPISAIAQPLHAARETDSVADTLDRMIREQQHMLLVEDEFGGTAGLVTLEDCVETLLGVEIVDETDSTDDMREAARQLVKRRRQQRE